VSKESSTVGVELHIATAEDKVVIRSLLAEVNLPTESVDTGTTTFYIGMEDHSVVGVAGFEFYGKDALLRSVAVPPKVQKRGYGDRITERMISTAKSRGIERIVLLTETAERFFARMGFATIDRASIKNDAMKRSSEFAYACPSSATCMVLELKRENP